MIDESVGEKIVGWLLLAAMAWGFWRVMWSNLRWIFFWHEETTKPNWNNPRWMAWIAPRGSFVFTEELQGWPLVRRVAPSAAAGAGSVLLMKAPYIGPRRVRETSGFRPLAATGLVVGVLYYLRFNGEMETKDLLENAAFLGVILGLASYPFWRLARKTRLVIRFELEPAAAKAGGTISWKGPDRKKYRVQFGEERPLEVLLPHRWADDERRKHGDWMQRNRGQSAPKPLFQISSELVMHTGPGGRNWLTVAEFCNDGSGERAHLLKTAIEFVSGELKKELVAKEKQAAADAPL